MGRQPTTNQKSVKTPQPTGEMASNNNEENAIAIDSTKPASPSPFASADNQEEAGMEEHLLTTVQGRKWTQLPGFQTLLAAVMQQYGCHAASSNAQVQKLSASNMHHYGLVPKTETCTGTLAICNICDALLKPSYLERHVNTQHRYNLRGTAAPRNGYRDGLAGRSRRQPTYSSSESDSGSELGSEPSVAQYWSSARYLDGASTGTPVAANTRANTRSVRTRSPDASHASAMKRLKLRRTLSEVEKVSREMRNHRYYLRRRCQHQYNEDAPLHPFHL